MINYDRVWLVCGLLLYFEVFLHSPMAKESVKVWFGSNLRSPKTIMSWYVLQSAILSQQR